VSPSQILGDKNFADLPDAPDSTHVPAWHIKLLNLPKQLTVRSKNTFQNLSGDSVIPDKMRHLRLNLAGRGTRAGMKE